jgi:hypothetical protein
LLGRGGQKPSEAFRPPVMRAEGVGPASPLAALLRRDLAGLACLVMAEPLSVGPLHWRRLVAGTALQWFGGAGQGPEPEPEPATPDLVLDLHEDGGVIAGRVWRVVDSAGRSLLRPLFGAQSCHRAPYAASLYLIESMDGGQTWHILAEAHPYASRPYRDLLDSFGRISAWLVATALRANSRQARPWRPTASPSPHTGLLLRSVIAEFAFRLRNHLTSEIWAIGILPGPAERVFTTAVVAPLQWIQIPAKDGFIADPCPWPGRPDVVLCEHYVHRTGLGILEALTIRDGRILGSDPVLVGESHLSYPYAWADGDRVLCLPEMAAARQQVLYELVPGKTAHPLCVIADKVAMGDPTLFRHEDRYWLAYTDTDLGLYDNLCLMYASRPEGPWTLHPANPVKIDVRSSRCGGTPFRFGESLFRPAQDCSRTYGGALVLNRVVTCTPEHYCEEQVATLVPNPSGAFPHGLHTLSAGPDGILVDGKRIVFDARVILHRIRRRIVRNRNGNTPSAGMRAD